MRLSEAPVRCSVTHDPEPFRFHIHSGVSCATTADPDGHYYDASSNDDYMSSDPWTTTYTSDSSGAATVHFSMESFTLTSDYPVSWLLIKCSSADLAFVL